MFSKFFGKLPLQENIKLGKFLRLIEQTLLKFHSSMSKNNRNPEHEEESKEEKPECEDSG